MTELSRKAIDRLGERLAAGPPWSDADLEALAEYQAATARALDLVEARVREILIESAPGMFHAMTKRPAKTLPTLVEKIRRGLPLGSIRDLAGVRLIVFDHRLQEPIADAIEAAFVDSKRIDRREAPSNGYRAIHLEIKVDRRRVELQLRTLYQHVWADATEQLGDRWGRGIRYGDPPGGEPHEVPVRAAQLAAWMAVSDGFYQFERHSSHAQLRTHDVMMAGLGTLHAGAALANVGDEIRHALMESLHRVETLLEGR